MNIMRSQTGQSHDIGVSIIRIIGHITDIVDMDYQPQVSLTGIVSSTRLLFEDTIAMNMKVNISQRKIFNKRKSYLDFAPFILMVAFVTTNILLNSLKPDLSRKKMGLSPLLYLEFFKKTIYCDCFNAHHS